MVEPDPTLTDPQIASVGRSRKPPRTLDLIALDPGNTTGIAITTFNTTSGLCSGIQTYQLTGEHHVDLYRLLINESPNIVIFERFVYQQRREEDGSLKKVELEAREYIGVAKLYANMTEKTLAPQMASDAMKLWDDEKLHKLGLWEPNRPHAMDAVRHLLLFVTKRLKSNQFLIELRHIEALAGGDT